MLSFSVSDLLIMMFNLLVLFVLLRIFLFKPVTKIMDDRTKTISDGLAAADAGRVEADRLQAEYEQKLTDARGEAAELVARAKERGEREYQSILAAAEVDARKLREDTRTQLAAEREAMLQGARHEVAALALLAAAKVTGKAMDEASDRALVSAFLSEAGDGA